MQGNASSSQQIVDLRQRWKQAISDAFTFELPPLGIVDLSQQKLAPSGAIEVRFFTDTSDNEFLKRIREAKVTIKESRGVSL